MRRIGPFLAALVLAAGLAGCTTGGECDRCDSDNDCDTPLVCRNFDVNGKDAGKRCASGAGATTCRVLR
jgi:hypothetical protein